MGPGEAFTSTTDTSPQVNTPTACSRNGSKEFVLDLRSPSVVLVIQFTQWQCILFPSHLPVAAIVGWHPEIRRRWAPKAVTAALWRWADLVWIRLTDIGLFFSTRDSNSPFRSQGNDTATSPKLVHSVLQP